MIYRGDIATGRICSSVSMKDKLRGKIERGHLGSSAISYGAIGEEERDSLLWAWLL